MQEVLCRPTVLLAAIGPQDARERGPAEHQQRAEGLELDARQQAALGKHAAPLQGKRQEGGEQRHLLSRNRPKVFFSVRVKRSPRATFLVSEETRDSRSTAMPKAA